MQNRKRLRRMFRRIQSRNENYLKKSDWKRNWLLQLGR